MLVLSMTDRTELGHPVNRYKIMARAAVRGAEYNKPQQQKQSAVSPTSLTPLPSSGKTSLYFEFYLAVSEWKFWFYETLIHFFTGIDVNKVGLEEELF